ncbi:MAG: 6-pyruvoyl trahydropterin synthase family protein [Phycisphaeraceae bacterium]
MYEITVESVFAAAHAIRLPDGSLEPAHGHNWPVTLTVRADRLDDIETVCDFHLLQDLLDRALAPWQNNDLNRCEPFADAAGELKVNPTAERVARAISDKVFPSLPESCTLVSVRVGEAPGCTASYYPHREDA